MRILYEGRRVRMAKYRGPMAARARKATVLHVGHSEPPRFHTVLVHDFPNDWRCVVSETDVIPLEDEPYPSPAR